MKISACKTSASPSQPQSVALTGDDQKAFCSSPSGLLNPRRLASAAPIGAFRTSGAVSSGLFSYPHAACAYGSGRWLRCVLPLSTPWWTVARPLTLIHVNGWRMSCSGFPGTITIAKPSGNSCQTSGQNKPTRINLTQL